MFKKSGFEMNNIVSTFMLSENPTHKVHGIEYSRIHSRYILSDGGSTDKYLGIIKERSLTQRLRLEAGTKKKRCFNGWETEIITRSQRQGISAGRVILGQRFNARRKDYLRVREKRGNT